MFARGFTGHEHLPEFNLINMNGRVYDPILGRFLSPDNYIQLPDYTQSLNRYSYALNNPLIFTDPTGEKWKWKYLSPFYWFDQGMQWINDNTSGLRQTMVDANIPAFGAGYNTAHGGFHYFGNSGNMYHNQLRANKPEAIMSNVTITLTNSYTDGRSVNFVNNMGVSWGNVKYGEAGGGSGQSGMLDWWNDKTSQTAFLTSAASYNMGKEMTRWRPSYDGMGNTVVKAGTNFNPWVVNTGKILRTTGGVLGTATTIYSGLNFINNPNWENGANTIFGAISFLNWPGMVVSGFYSATKANIEYTQKHPQYCQGGMGMYRWSCFVSGTKVTTGDYSCKNIEDIVVGDSIITYNFQTKNLEVSKVTELETPVHDGLIQVEFSDGTKIINTGAHPYYTKNKGWCSFEPELSFTGFRLKTSMLEIGDKCFVIKNKKLNEIEIINITELPGKEKTYNIIGISKNNNYFVYGILVHNESYVTPKKQKKN
jgi:RHS repeat-associated protein